MKKLEKYFKEHKTVGIILGVGVFFLVMIGVTFLLSPQSSPTNPANNQEQNAQNGSTNINGSDTTVSTNSKGQSTTFNPLVNKDEFQRVQKAFSKDTSQKPTYQFQYHLSPGLTEKSSMMFIQSAEAAGNCDVSNAPATLNAYTLKDNLSPTDAQSIAGEYAITAQPASIPTDNKTSFQYYFTNPQESSYLTVTESSGITYFHVAPPPPGQAVSPMPTIAQPQAQTLSDSILSQHNLSTNLVLKGVNPDSTGSNFLFTYRKDYGMKIIDSSSLNDLTNAQTVCDVVDAPTMNYIQVIISNKSKLWKLLNTTRAVTSSYQVQRESLADALVEYKNKPLIPPVVSGNATVNTGDVTINQVSLVNYDFGNSYAQSAYVPMYLTSGTTATGVRVITLFPAVKQSDLAKTPILDIALGHQTLQLNTFSPVPAISATPAPPHAPSVPGKVATGINLCYGGEVDYEVNCKDGTGQTVCEDDPTFSQDPMAVCSSGCQTKNADVTITSGQSACKQFLQQNSLPTTGGDEGGFGFPSGFSLPGTTQPAGTYSCQIRGCPC